MPAPVHPDPFFPSFRLWTAGLSDANNNALYAFYAAWSGYYQSALRRTVAAAANDDLAELDGSPGDALDGFYSTTPTVPVLPGGGAAPSEDPYPQYATDAEVAAALAGRPTAADLTAVTAGLAGKVGKAEREWSVLDPPFMNGDPDGVADNTAAINAAVDACYAAGGGRVVMPRRPNPYVISRRIAGVTDDGGIRLRRGVSLRGDNTQINLNGLCHFIWGKSVLGAQVFVTADTTASDTTLTVNTSTGVTVGNTVLVQLGQAPYDAFEPDHWFFAKVTATTSTTVTIDRPTAYAMTAASVTDQDQRSITVIAEMLENVTVEGFRLYNPTTGAANAETGIRFKHGRGLKVRNVSGENCGATLVYPQFVEGLSIDVPTVTRCQNQGSHIAKGRALSFAEVRAVTVDGAVLENCEQQFIFVESGSDAVKFRGMKIKNNFPGRNNVTKALIIHVGNARAEYDGLVVEGAGATFFDRSADFDSTASFRDATFRCTTTNLAIPYLRDFVGSLSINGVRWDDIKRYSATHRIPAGVGSTIATLPAGLLRRLKMLPSTLTGVTFVFPQNGTTNAANQLSRLTAGTLIDLSNGVCGYGTAYPVNAYSPNQVRVVTDATFPGGYFTVEAEVYCPATGDDGVAGQVTGGDLRWFGADVNLYRKAAAVLRTDDSFEVGGTLKVGGSLVAATPPAFATTLGEWHAPGATFGTSATLGFGTLRVAAYYISQACTVAQAAAEITAAGTAGNVLRLGIYADSGGKPGALVADWGTIAADAVAGFAKVTGLSTALAPGLYWVGGVVQGATTQPTVRTIASSQYAGSLGSADPAIGTVFGAGWFVTGVTGALPGSFGAAAATGAAPRVHFKLST